jgi:hypothetical protein
MKSNHPACSAADASFERKLIRFDLPSAHAGVTAALRRAFAPVDDHGRDREFDELLKLLN